MEKRVGYEIKTLDNMIERKIISNCKKQNDTFITPVQVHIMKYLYENKDVYQSDLEKKLKFRRSTSLGILKTMEKNGLIIRMDCKENPRLKKIVITDMALLKLESLQKQFKLFEKTITSGITLEELNIFFRVIEKIKNNLEEEKEC